MISSYTDHNIKMTEIKSRIKRKRQQSPDIPTSVWQGVDIFEDIPVSSLTVILRTIGCYWSRREGCTMCGYFNDSAAIRPTYENLLSQLDYALEKMSPQTAVIKIFTSGSFFDDQEIAPAVRINILERIGKRSTVKKVVAETRPEFVNEKNLTDTLEILHRYHIKFEIAMGLETTNDMIRKDCINKGFTFNDFISASGTAKTKGVSTKAYLLLKPPFISEKTAVEDILASISDTVSHASTISLNLCNVQKGTLVEELFERKSYRPPWLWSALFILREAKEKFPDIIFISDPVAAGAARGPHNCGKCDGDVARLLRDFSITQDKDILSGVDCECYPLWEKMIALENNAFGSYLVK